MFHLSMWILFTFGEQRMIHVCDADERHACIDDWFPIFKLFRNHSSITYPKRSTNKNYYNAWPCMVWYGVWIGCGTCALKERKKEKQIIRKWKYECALNGRRKTNIISNNWNLAIQHFRNNNLPRWNGNRKWAKDNRRKSKCHW